MTDTAPTDSAVHGARLAKLGLLAALVSRLFSRLVGIVLVVLLARFAEADTVAVYGYLLGTATLVATLTDLGVATIAGRDVAAGRLPADGALRAALAPQAASLVAAAAVTVLLTVGLGPDRVPPVALALTVVFVVIGGFNNLWAELLRGSGRVLLEGGLQMASATALVLGGVIVVYRGGDSDTMATALLAVVAGKELAVLAVGVWLIRPHRRPEARTRALLGQSAWLAVAGTALILLWRQGTLVIGGLGNIGALATYVVASRFLDAGVTLAHTAGFGLVPGMSALAGQPAALRRATLRYLGLAAVVGAVVALVGLVAAGPLTTVPFGARWADAVPSVRVIAVTALPILVAFVAWPTLLARRQLRTVTVGCVAGAAVGVVVSLLLVARRPEALSPVIGTAAGATVLAVILLIGLRDLLTGPPTPEPVPLDGASPAAGPDSRPRSGAPAAG
jgi:O-antigen/teichoic acid export membrane protein